MSVVQLAQSTIDSFLLKHPWTILRISKGSRLHIPLQIIEYFDTEYPGVFGYGVLDTSTLKVPASWWEKFKSGYAWPGRCRQGGQDGYYMLIDGKMEVFCSPLLTNGDEALGALAAGLLFNVSGKDIISGLQSREDEKAAKAVNEAIQSYLAGHFFKHRDRLADAKRAGLQFRAKKKAQDKKRFEDAVKEFKKRTSPPPRPPPSDRSQPVRDPWQIIGIPRTTSYQDAKKAYKQRVGGVHPDRLEQLGGLDPDFKDLAERKMKDLNWAWDTIRRENGWESDQAK